jgi:hypothetical protein
MGDLLRTLGLKPFFFDDMLNIAQQHHPHPLEVIKLAFETVQAVVVLLSGDDLACLHPAYVQCDDPPEE